MIEVNNLFFTLKEIILKKSEEVNLSNALVDQSRLSISKVCARLYVQ